MIVPVGTQVKFRRVCMALSEHNWANISETICGIHNAGFWYVGLLDVVLSKYLDKSHNFTNLIFYDVKL